MIKKIRAARVFLYLFMLLLVSFTALPLVYIAITAFKPMNELFLFPPRFFVSNPTLKNFSELLISFDTAAVPFLRYVFNSVVISSSIVLFTVFFSSFGAFGLVKHRPKGHRLVFNIIIAALMFAPQVTQIPRYMIMNFLGMVNTPFSLIIPSIGTALNLFLMKQFIEQFPDSLLESARLDGAKELQIFWKIVMPALAPAWSTLIVLTFVTNWNDYFTPLIYVQDEALKTLPIALQTIAGGVATASIGRAGAVAAATLVTITPPIVIFTLMQRRVMETMVHSGIKG